MPNVPNFRDQQRLQRIATDRFAMKQVIGQISVQSVAPAPSQTPSSTPTNTPTPSVTPTNTVTPTCTPTPSVTPTQTHTPGLTPTPTPTVTSADVWPVVVPLSGTVPPRPCNGGGGCGASCLFATYTVSASAGTKDGVAASTLSFYLGGVLKVTRAASAGAYAYTSLCGNTAYAGYVIDDFDRQSEGFSFTTPAYV